MHFKAFILAILPAVALAQVKGTAPGYAAGVTGGGNATPQYPSSIAQYASRSFFPEVSRRY